MGIQEYLGIGAIVATVITALVSWILSAYLTKKNLKRKKLKYEIKLYPMMSKKFINRSSEFEVYFQGELLPEPTLLAVDIINAGNIAIENPPIEIKAIGATYIIPGYIDDLPPGYEDLWRLERNDADSSEIILNHINPGQTVKARFFLDEMPEVNPIFKCPMANVEVQKVDTEINKVIFSSFTDTIIYSFLPRGYIDLLHQIFKKT